MLIGNVIHLQLLKQGRDKWNQWKNVTKDFIVYRFSNAVNEIVIAAVYKRRH